MNIEAGFLEPIDQPVPVVGGLDNYTFERLGTLIKI